MTVYLYLESEVASPDKKSEKQSQFDYPIKPHELKAMNYLINEYLLANSFKLTSITFSDENENQDFEDWQDVGLNIPKPPELLQIYREFMRGVGYDKPPQSTIEIQTDEDEEAKKNLENLNNLVRFQLLKITCRIIFLMMIVLTDAGTRRLEATAHTYGRGKE